jgi:hypothetical protein
VKTPKPVVFARVPPALYAAILKRQEKIEKKTGIKPPISDIVRTMLAESAGMAGAR